MKDHIRSVSAGVYSALLNLLKGNNVPKKEWTKNIVAAYRIQRRKIKQTLNPLTGNIEERVLINPRRACAARVTVVVLCVSE